jgi:ketosteroid isomerase-like protein
MARMHGDRGALQEANELFYKALEGLDLEMMDRVWLHEGWVRCVHPGSDVIIGWPLVRKSWEQIFANTRWIRVTPTGVEMNAFGEVGLVACSENITATSGGEVGVAVAQATNLFRKGPGGWRMIHHHASPSPVSVTQPLRGPIQ